VRLEEASQRTLAIGSLSALAVVVLAAWVWRSTRRHQEMEREADQARHLAALGEMSAVLAHEIRNPLASLKGHAQLLAELADARTEGRVRRVIDEALRLERLTNHLLDFARSGTVQPVPTSPAEVLEVALRASAPERIEVDSGSAPATWSLDGARLEQVLINLLDNALQVTPADRKVTARVAAHDGELVFEVRDHGPGVPPDQRERIFEPFHTTKVHGTGLGLAVARRIVTLHGGSIEIEDAPTGGAIFRVRLPS
jgi:two-component system sensor histidine kinase HydH